MNDFECLVKPLRVENQYQPHKPRGYWPITSKGGLYIGLSERETLVVNTQLGSHIAQGTDGTTQIEATAAKKFDASQVWSIAPNNAVVVNVLKDEGFVEQPTPVLIVSFVEPVEG
jgi:hypothetical protein